MALHITGAKDLLALEANPIFSYILTVLALSVKARLPFCFDVLVSLKGRHGIYLHIQ
jgi:hypothetical protein